MKNNTFKRNRNSMSNLIKDRTESLKKTNLSYKPIIPLTTLTQSLNKLTLPTTLHKKTTSFVQNSKTARLSTYQDDVKRTISHRINPSSSKQPTPKPNQNNFFMCQSRASTSHDCNMLTEMENQKLLVNKFNRVFQKILKEILVQRQLINQYASKEYRSMSPPQISSHDLPFERINSTSATKLKKSFLNESSQFIDPVAEELRPHRASIIAKERHTTYLTHNEMVAFLQKLGMVDSSTKNENTLRA